MKPDDLEFTKEKKTAEYKIGLWYNRQKIVAGRSLFRMLKLYFTITSEAALRVRTTDYRQHYYFIWIPSKSAQSTGVALHIRL